jgi:hypothetical protein
MRLAVGLCRAVDGADKKRGVRPSRLREVFDDVGNPVIEHQRVQSIRWLSVTFNHSNYGIIHDQRAIGVPSGIFVHQDGTQFLAKCELHMLCSTGSMSSHSSLLTSLRDPQCSSGTIGTTMLYRTAPVNEEK